MCRSQNSYGEKQDVFNSINLILMSSTEKKVILAISGSQRNPSLSDKMLDSFISGMGQEYKVYKFYPHKMDIKPCIGCFHCWQKNYNGICIHRDEFEKILDIYKIADYVVFATPLYIFDFPATVKIVFDRLFIDLKSDQVEVIGGTEHPKRFPRDRKAILISSCGFPDIEEFDIIKQHFAKICKAFGWEHAGNIFVSAAGLFHSSNLLDKKFDLIKSAGEEVSSDGKISEAIQHQISAYVMPKEVYRQMTTAAF
jgi:multimeric flavodoxin WrbA